jgi:hypothetical protein
MKQLAGTHKRGAFRTATKEGYCIDCQHLPTSGVWFSAIVKQLMFLVTTQVEKKSMGSESAVVRSSRRWRRSKIR